MADKKWSQFPSATPENDDVVVGLHAGGNVRFTVANFVLAVRQGLANLFVPQTRTVNSKALNNDITLTMDDISDGTTYAKPTAVQVAQIDTNEADIDAIEGKIPSAASTTNQLADKAFVTDAITQGTAIFRGSFATKAALLAVAWQTTDPDAPYYVSNNDYAVVLDDETQNDECWRYIYVTGTGWTPQYRINESPLTQAQLDALNSGATSAIINSVADKLDKNGDGSDVTAAFTAASARTNISTGEKLSVIFGKIAKWFSDLGTAAFRAATGNITSGSTDLVESGAIYTGLAGKQNNITANGILKGDGAGGVSAATPGTDYQAPLTFDNTPTANSANPVKSGGVYSDVRTRVPNYGKGKNLLDNAYFVGGGTGRGVFPVNRRGASSYTGLVYGIDRWVSLTTGGTLTIGADYITLQAATYNFNWKQFLSEKIPVGSTITLTVLKSDGSLVTGTGTLSSTTSYVQVSLSSGYIRAYYDYAQFTTGANGTNTIKAVKLELGSEQTLCHNEGTAESPVWVLNEIPDYEEELIKCQTSTADTSDIYANKVIATNVSNKNLLDNAYFVGGGTGRGVFPVNQRGNDSYSGAIQYTINRWRTSNANTTISLTSSGVVTSASGTAVAYLLQRINHQNILLGKTVTLSVLTSTGLYKATATLPSSTPSSTVTYASITNIGQIIYISNVCYIRLTSAAGGGNTYCAVKLELGTEQTLAHQENGVWVLNEIPDYEYELYRCITSTADSSDTYANKSLATEQQLAPVEWGTTASRPYVVGECFCWNGLLYRAKKGISSGGTFTPETNCEPTTVGNEVYSSVARKLTFTVPANGSLDIVNATGQYSYLLFAVSTNAAAAGVWVIMSLSTATASRIIQRLYTPSNPVTSIASRSYGITIANGSSEVLNISIIADTDGFYKP